jgi:tetratricopeptide (TPR) repeat protein
MDECESNTPEQDMEIAEEALAQGDPRHAVFHIAWALATDPLRRDWRAVLDRIIAGVEDPIRLAPLDGENSFAMVAVHAYILGRRGHYDRAIGLLLQVFAVRPDLPYLAWIREWRWIPAAAKSFDLTALFPGIKALLKRFPGTVVTIAEDRALLEGLLPLTQQLWDLRDELVPAARPSWSRWFAWDRHDRKEPDPKVHGFFLFFVTSVLRKAGRFDEALRRSDAAYRRVPGYLTAVGLAMALAARGEVDRAVAAYRDSARHDPGDVSGLMDAAELLWEHRRSAEAERLYEEILQKSPDDPRALPIYCYLRYLSSDCDASWLERLRDFVDAHPDHRQGRDLLRAVTPYFGFLPSPSDAFVKMLRKVARSMEDQPSEPEAGPFTLNYRVSGPEAPSNRLAFELLARRLGQPIELAVTIEAIPEPDPRRPLGRVSYQLWRYEETEPIPVLPPPSDEVAQAVAAIATGDYDLASWAGSAAHLGRSIGAERVDDLLGVMVHPPLAPDPFTPWDWVLRIQFAAALTVTGLDEGWARSLRRKVLVSLVNGPMDWSVEAAIIALSQLAAADPEVAADALEIFRARFRNLPDRGYTCYAVPLVLAMLEQPGVTGEERTELRAKLRELS